MSNKKSIKIKIITIVVAVFFAVVAVIATVLSVKSCSNSESPTTLKRMEKLDRGLVAITCGSSGNFLSWRLLGTESLENQAFDVYRNGELITTTGAHDATQIIDADGGKDDKYKVVCAGENASNEKETSVITNTLNASPNASGYIDLKFDFPEPDERTVTDSDGNETTEMYPYHPDNTSVGDLDGDGEYELVVLMLAKESTNMTGYTSPAYLYGLDVDWNTGATEKLWEISVGRNITSGQHYNCFLVYDLDGDDKAEVMLKTAPGTKDGQGNFVSEAGATDEIKNCDNTKLWVNSGGKVMDGPEYLTIFNGKTGRALQTVNYSPHRSIISTDVWGDTFDNRSGRYLATVAYLNGETPSAVMCRGYYTNAYLAAYDWDGKNLTRRWFSEGAKNGTTVTYADGTQKTCEATAYNQGNHSLAVADCDNDGYDEIVYGSAVIDHDGTVLYSTGRGHGDAHHVSDYNNDGITEVFQVHESGAYGADLRQYDPNSNNGFKDLGIFMSSGDVGRGCIGNLDDTYALNNANASALYWTSSGNTLYDINGNEVGSGARPNSNGTYFANFTVLWDGDLGTELLDGTKLGKHHISAESIYTERLNWSKQYTYMPGVSTNNGSKAVPCLTADILGDWREEILMHTSEGIRVFISAITTEYRLTTLMHDGQYRCQVSSENSGYNQPPHTSYYIGSLALKVDGEGNKLNYLEPKKPFDKIRT